MTVQFAVGDVDRDTLMRLATFEHVRKLATLLSLAVTIISTLQTKLGFERKWIANRMTRSALSQLRVDMNMGQSPQELADSLKKIYSQHDEAIAASS